MSPLPAHLRRCSSWWHSLLPDELRAVQAPPGATQLGVALWLYPTAAARLLAQANLGSLIDGNLWLRRRLGISDAQTAKALFKDHSLLVSSIEREEAMVTHLQRLQASGALSAEQGEHATHSCRFANAFMFHGLSCFPWPSCLHRIVLTSC